MTTKKLVVGATFSWMVVALLWLLVPPSPNYHYPAAAARAEVADDEWARKIAAKIRYIYDERTGLCFARLGVGLSLVPYEKVKDHLLNPPEKLPKK